MIFFIISFYVISYFIYFSAIYKRTLSSQYYNIITKFMCSKSAQLRKRSVLLLWTDKFQQAHHRNRTYTKHPYDTVSVIWTSCVNPTQAMFAYKKQNKWNKWYYRLFGNTTQWKPASCRDQSTDLLRKSINWFPHNTSAHRKASQNRP